MKYLAWVLTVGLLVGCASMAAFQTTQARYQAMADQATDAAGVGHVRVLLKAHSTQGLYVRWNQTVELGMDNSTQGNDWLLAHELSHHLLGHISALLAQEMAANANAVSVLVLWGYREADAVRLVQTTLLAVQRRGSSLTGVGHDWCREYTDITQRYPYAADLRRPGECGAQPSLSHRP